MKFFSCFQRYERIILLRRKWLPERLRLFTAIHNNTPIAYGGPTWSFGGGLTYPCHGTACIAYRRRLLKFVGSNLMPTEASFWCSLLPMLSYLTVNFVSENEAILSVKEWNHKMKSKQRKRTVVIKKILRSAYISDQKTKSVYFKLRAFPPLSYATAEYCLYIF